MLRQDRVAVFGRDDQHVRHSLRRFGGKGACNKGLRDNPLEVSGKGHSKRKEAGHQDVLFW